MELTLSEELKNATASIHAKLDNSDFFACLKSKALPIESYVNYLQAMAGIHGVLEKELLNNDHPTLNFVWQKDMEKLPTLLVDLESLNSTQISDIPLAIDGMLDTIKFIRISNIENPLSLLGIMYVLEGSTLGGSILKKMVLDNFNFSDEESVLYLDFYKTEKKQHWENFKIRMNSLNLNPQEKKIIIQTAMDFFEKIKSIFVYLYPLTKTVPFYNVSSLNPEAGRYKIPADEKEIQAALNAGLITWEKYPYYAWRYGLRGKQFTRSDSVWLVTLCDLTENLVIDQVNWLGRVLSSRGMPQILLSNHLLNLVVELKKANPEKFDHYGKLRIGSSALRVSYNTIFSQDHWNALVNEFEVMIGIEWNHRLKNMGEIILAAVVDEALGIEGALASVESWLSDKNRFPIIWIDAVDQLIRKAQMHTDSQLQLQRYE